MLWCLSPVGGQASLRLLQRSQSTESATVPLKYASTGPASAMLLARLKLAPEWKTTAAISSSRAVMARHEDVFGNVKIPRYEALNASIISTTTTTTTTTTTINTTVAADDDVGWKDVPAVMQPEDFSSIMGLRVVGRPRDRDSAFSLEASYLSANCSRFVQLPYALNWTRAHVDNMSRQMQFNFSAAAAAGWLPGQRLTAQAPGRIHTWFISIDANSSPQRFQAYHGLPSSAADGDDSAAKLAVPRQLFFGSLYINSKGRRTAINLARCTLHETRVEAAVHCRSDADGGSCRVRRVRRSLADRRPRTVTLFDSPAIAERWSQMLPDSFAVSNARRSSDAEFFFAGNVSSVVGVELVNATDPQAYFVDLSQLAPGDFGARLSLFLNAFSQEILLSKEVEAGAAAALARYDNASLPAHDLRMFLPPMAPSSSSSSLPLLSTEHEYERFYLNASRAIFAAFKRGLPFVPAATVATASRTRPVYLCHFGWLATLLLATLALLVAGAASLVMQLRCTLAPDMLRYVSSMVCASQYIRTPDGGTALDGMERASLLRRLRIRVGDVNGDGNVGEIMLVLADNATASGLQRKRLYA
jgi:hypothetical protein